MEKNQAIEAIAARIAGNYDNPQLLKIGALNTDPLKDIQVILNLIIPQDEPVKTTITSREYESRLYVIYHGGDLKVIEPDGTIVFMPYEELAEINTAIKNP